MIVACALIAWPAAVTPASASTLVTSCSAEAANVLGTPVVAANPQMTPCSDGRALTVNEYYRFPIAGGTGGDLAMNGPQSFTVNLTGGPAAFTSIDGLSLVFNPDLNLSLSADHLGSAAGASIGPCPSTASLSGSSSVSDLYISALGQPPISYSGDQPQTFEIPGVATIAVNQQVISGGTLTVQALDVKLAATGQEIAVAQSTAGATCS